MFFCQLTSSCFQGNLPEDEEALSRQLSEHQALSNDIHRREGALQDCMALGEGHARLGDTGISLLLKRC